MKIYALNHFLCATALGSIDFLFVGCSDKKTMAYVSPTAGKITPTPVASPAVFASDVSSSIAIASPQPGVVADGWIAIKDDTYEQRPHFFSGLQALEAGVDRRIAAIKAKDGSVSGSRPDAVVTIARTNLQAATDKLNLATADSWMSAKNMFALAWMRMQAAFTKAQSS